MKKIVAISDVHVKYPGDDSDKLLSRFLTHPEVLTADYVLLLGDIYDLMCGPHEEYLKNFSHHFEALRSLAAQNKKVYFFEGNHDVHLKLLMSKVCKIDQIVLSPKPVLEIIDGKLYYFSHGDEHEIDNFSYHRYIRIIRSAPLEFVANHVMPYKLLKFLGENASKFSRKKGSRTFNADSVKERFRLGVIKTISGDVDFVIGGHSHVKDEFKIPEKKTIYVNNGYAPHTKSFIIIENHKIQFKSIA